MGSPGKTETSGAGGGSTNVPGEGSSDSESGTSRMTRSQHRKRKRGANVTSVALVAKKRRGQDGDDSSSPESPRQASRAEKTDRPVSNAVEKTKVHEGKKSKCEEKGGRKEPTSQKGKDTGSCTSTRSGGGTAGPKACSEDSCKATDGSPAPDVEGDLGRLQQWLMDIKGALSQRGSDQRRLVRESIAQTVDDVAGKIAMVARSYCVENARLSAQVKILLASQSLNGPGGKPSNPGVQQKVGPSDVKGRPPVGSYAAAAARVRLPKPPSPSVCVDAGAVMVSGSACAGGPTAKAPPKQDRKVVVVKAAATGESKSGEEIKALVTKIPELRQAKLRVNRVTAVRGSVVFEMKDGGSKSKLLDSPELAKHGLVAVDKELRRPEIRIFDVPKEMSDEEVIRDVVDLNLAEKTGKNEWGDAIKATHRIGQRERGLTSVVLTVSAEVRALLLGIKRLAIEYRSCRVIDHTRVARCYRCQRYGHVKKHCRSEKDVCVHCGGAGHVAAQCRKRDSPPQCVNCRNSSGNVAKAHRADSTVCPARAKALGRMIANTQYAVSSRT